MPGDCKLLEQSFTWIQSLRWTCMLVLLLIILFNRFLFYISILCRYSSPFTWLSTKSEWNDYQNPEMVECSFFWISAFLILLSYLIFFFYFYCHPSIIFVSFIISETSWFHFIMKCSFHHYFHSVALSFCGSDFCLFHLLKDLPA